MRPMIFALALLALAACAAPDPQADPLAAGGRIFAVQCTGCHAREAGGEAGLGPGLAAMRARAAARPDPAAWLRAAVVAPNAELAPGYQPGLMPGGYGQSLGPAELDALAAYMLAPADE